MMTPRAILLTSFAAALLTGCDHGEPADYPSHMALTTVHAIASEAAGGYYFSLDNGDKIYPGDTDRLGHFDATDKDGKRAIIYFNMLETQHEGYDLNVALYCIENILSKPIESASTNEELASFGDDRIGIQSAWMGNGWLNICYALPTDGTAMRPHRLSLVENRTGDIYENAPEGYTCLELRHDANDDLIGRMAEDYVCFKLADYDPAVTGAKGIAIRFKPLFGAPYFVKVEPRSTK